MHLFFRCCSVASGVGSASRCFLRVFFVFFDAGSQGTFRLSDVCGITVLTRYGYTPFTHVFFLMLSSFSVFIFLCTVDMVHCGYQHLVRASLMCSLSFRLSSSSVTSVSHLSSKLVTCGSLPPSGVMDGVRKSLGIGLSVKCPKMVSFLLLLLLM